MMDKVKATDRKRLLEAKTLQELKETAKKTGLSIKKGWKKADIVKALAKMKSEVKKKTKVTAKPVKAAAKKPAKKKTTAKKKPSPKIITKKPGKAGTVKAKKEVAKKATKKLTKKIKEKASVVVPVITQTISPITPPLVNIPVLVRSPEGRMVHEEDRIVLLARDPNWIFAYWELCDKTLKTFQKRLPDSHLTVRVYDVTGCGIESPNRFFDINIPGMSGSWHIKVKQPDREFLVEIGLLSLAGNFLTIARSNRVLTPRDGVELTGLEDWRTEELYRTAYKIDLEKLRISS
ncbi:MAG: DUF4912 domain-containing protein [Nitrospirae bacterium]|nr:DUF4912 domain-containing protein [Nitrospirota bacterium]